LFFGVVNYLYKLYNFEKLYVEVNDKKWFEYWIDLNENLLDFEIDKIVCVVKGYSGKEIKCCLKVF